MLPKALGHDEFVIDDLRRNDKDLPADRVGREVPSNRESSMFVSLLPFY